MTDKTLRQLKTARYSFQVETLTTIDKDLDEAVYGALNALIVSEPDSAAWIAVTHALVNIHRAREVLDSESTVEGFELRHATLDGRAQKRNEDRRAFWVRLTLRPIDNDNDPSARQLDWRDEYAVRVGGCPITGARVDADFRSSARVASALRHRMAMKGRLAQIAGIG